MHSTIISTDALAGLLDSASPILVVDCRFDLTDEAWGAAQYDAAHIPGAVYASLSHDLAGQATGRNGRHPMPTPDAMIAAFSRLGVSTGLQVVAYDQDTGLFASRLWWMLRYMGHDAVAVLDGGLAKWKAEGRPLRGGRETKPPAAFAGAPRADWHVSVSDVLARVGDPAVTLVDARGAERFEGRSEPLDRVAGHIPGARNHFYKQNVGPDGTLLPPHELKARLEASLGGADPRQVVMYCGSGVSACQNLLAMEHVGMPGAKLYPGSWSEWSADPSRPVETGPARQAGTPTENQP